MIVETRAEFVTVAYSFWKVELPREWVNRTPAIQRFLSRDAPASDISNDSDPSVLGVLTLLDLQGCLRYPDDRAFYTLKEVSNIFCALRASWYAQYYRHALWHRLREGSLSLNALVSWLIHNYHLSRSAGVSAARCSTRSPRADIRKLFRASAIEEYAHCNDFFFVNHEKLAIPDSAVKQHLPLAGSLAFDLQMLRIAEDDWLAHVLVALLQESSVRFFDSCVAFYATVETNYGLQGFFENWKKHLSLDLDYDHAGAFAGALDSNEKVSREQVQFSLRNAFFTFRHLLSALDEILENDRSDPTIELDLPNTQVSHLTLAELAREGIPTAKAPDNASDRKFLLIDVAESLQRVLGNSKAHDQVLLFGRLVEATTGMTAKVGVGDIQPISPWAMALANLLRESSGDPVEYAFLLFRLSGIDEGLVPISPMGLHQLAQHLERISSSFYCRLVDSRRQLDKFFHRWSNEQGLPAHLDFFRM